MNNYLLGAICGDICGAHYEFHPHSTKDYDKVKLIKPENRFTDDTVCTIGVADAILRYGNPTPEQFGKCIQEWCLKYPNRGYGGKFRGWIGNPVPYGSWGNGSAMRVSACGLAAKSALECIKLAENSAMCSHNSDSGIRGAKIAALSVFYAKTEVHEAKDLIHALVGLYPKYAEKCLDDIRPTYKFDSSCDGSVPVALLCFLESTNYEDCLKLAISMGGDADTLAAIAGGVAYAYYKEIPEAVYDNIKNVLPKDILKVVEDFDNLINE